MGKGKTRRNFIKTALAAAGVPILPSRALSFIGDQEYGVVEDWMLQDTDVCMNAVIHADNCIGSSSVAPVLMYARLVQ
jgi:hypothetical protein